MRALLVCLSLLTATATTATETAKTYHLHLDTKHIGHGRCYYRSENPQNKREVRLTMSLEDYTRTGCPLTVTMR